MMIRIGVELESMTWNIGIRSMEEEKVAYANPK